MTTQIILNPHANSGTAVKQIPSIRNAFDAAGFPYKMLITTEPNEATTAAYDASNNGTEIIVVAGGDGTINEVVNGMMQATAERRTKPLGIIPIGTGNDFSDMQGISHNIDTLIQQFRNRNTRQVDVGRATVFHQNSKKKYAYFDNNSAVAMEPMIALESQRDKRFKGKLGYVYALIKCLFKLKAWEMRVTWEDEKTGAQKQVEGDIYLLSVCNGPRTGSTFMMHPHAKIDDGLFDVVMLPKVPLRTVLYILPRFLNGSHLNHKLVSTFRTRRLNVVSAPVTPVQADGEIITSAAEQVQYTVLPGKLTLLTA